MDGCLPTGSTAGPEMGLVSMSGTAGGPKCRSVLLHIFFESGVVAMMHPCRRGRDSKLRALELRLIFFPLLLPHVHHTHYPDDPLCPCFLFALSLIENDSFVSRTLPFSLTVGLSFIVLLF